jgi:hypothetical protein
MGAETNILGLPAACGRALSNKALLRAAAELLPDGAALEIFDLEGITPFNATWKATRPAK